MGMISLLGMLEIEPNMEQVMRWHLGSNCYPPVNPDYIPMCLEVVRLYNDAEPDEIAALLDKEINLPVNQFYKNDKTTASWKAIVEAFHLEGFLQHQDDCDDEGLEWERTMSALEDVLLDEGNNDLED